MKKQINEIKRMQLLAGLITESEYRKSLVNEEMSKEDIMNKISKLKDFEDTEDNFKYGDHFVQKYGNDYAVWKDRGDATGSDPNPDFESSNIAKVVDFLMKKTNESSLNEELEPGFEEKAKAFINKHKNIIKDAVRFYKKRPDDYEESLIQTIYDFFEKELGEDWTTQISAPKPEDEKNYTYGWTDEKDEVFYNVLKSIL